MNLESLHTTENMAEESEKSLTLVRVNVEQSEESSDMLPKWPCGGIMLGD